MSVAEPKITVLGLGPGSIDLIPKATYDLIVNNKERVYLRTSQHIYEQEFINLKTFDYLYENAQDRATVYEQIAGSLVELAKKLGHIYYCVPGSPLIGEESVVRLLNQEVVPVNIVSAQSFLDIVFERLRVDPLKESIKIIDGEQFTTDSTLSSGSMIVCQCWNRDILSEIKLNLSDFSPLAITALQRLGRDDESIFEIDVNELDRAVNPDHLTTLYIKGPIVPTGVEFVKLEELVRELREKCPWDRVQTHESLAKNLIEECFEAVDAIYALGAHKPGGQLEEGVISVEIETQEDKVLDLKEELGDVLFQVFFHSKLASENGYFNVSDVAQSVREKLVSRHPHVFGGEELSSPEEVLDSWEKNKNSEKSRNSIFDGIPSSLPALSQLNKIAKKLSSKGLDPREVLISSNSSFVTLVLDLLSKGDYRLDLEHEVRSYINELKLRIE